MPEYDQYSRISTVEHQSLYTFTHKHIDCAMKAVQLHWDIQQLLGRLPQQRSTQSQSTWEIRDLPADHAAVAMGQKQQRQRERGIFATQVQLDGQAQISQPD